MPVLLEPGMSTWRGAPRRHQRRVVWRLYPVKGWICDECKRPTDAPDPDWLCIDCAHLAPGHDPQYHDQEGTR